MEENTSTEAPTVDTTNEVSQTNEEPTITYANGKFTNVGDMESSYLELQSSFSKKLGGFQGAPEAYEFSSEGFEANELSEALGKWGTENQLSNDGINSLYGALSELDAAREAQYEEQQQAYVAEQMEALGTNAETRVKNATDWINAMGGEGASDKLNIMAAGAEGLQLIENIMKKSQGVAPVAPSQPSVHVTEESILEMQTAKDQYGNDKMNDPKYAARVREHRKQLLQSFILGIFYAILLAEIFKLDKTLQIPSTEA